MKQIYVESYFRGYKRYLNRILPDDHPHKETIEMRVKILSFFDEHGEKATRDAFHVSRSTIYLWKKKLKDGGGKLFSLSPMSTAPIKRPGKKTDQKLVSFIKEYRMKYPRASKEELKPVVDRYARVQGVLIVSISTIGRIIKELKDKGLVPDPRKKLSFNALSGRFSVREKKEPVKKLRRKGFYPKSAGELVQLDAFHVFADGIKRYLITATCVKCHFAFAYGFNKFGSKSARSFMEMLVMLAPFRVVRIQTDNGSEFGKHFKSHVEAAGIVHYHSYPRHPQSNAHVERFNRTIRDQFLANYRYGLEDTATLNEHLLKYLFWYNTEKPHRSIELKAPMRYYLDSLPIDPEKSNMSWTLTRA